MSRPDAGLGLVLPAAAGWTERVQQREMQRPWSDLVADVRTGSPWWSPVRIPALDAEVNTIEYFVHHEDVRRAAGRWEPRQLPAEETDELWARLVRSARFIARNSPVGVVAVPTDGPAVDRSITLRAGQPSVTLRGSVGEMVLAIWGRVTSGLDITGDDDSIEAFLGHPR
jgi:uncharacterized protein (TIGR03085 family)